MILVPVPYDQLEQYRTVWLPFIERIAKRQRCSVEQRLADVYSGDVALILVWDEEKQIAQALCGYSITVRGPDRIFKLVWLTGHGRHDWTRLYSELEAFAKQVGCAGMVAVARPGWAKDLRGWGYRLTHVEYEKDFA